MVVGFNCVFNLNYLYHVLMFIFRVRPSTQSTTNSPEDIFFVPEIQYLFKRFV